MTTTHHEPIAGNWTTGERDKPDTGAGTGAVATARELAATLGGLHLDELRPWHQEIAVALIELARSAGRDWPWGHDDPLVALLRAVAKLSIQAPCSASPTAARLVAALDRAAELEQVSRPEGRSLSAPPAAG